MLLLRHTLPKFSCWDHKQNFAHQMMENEPLRANFQLVPPATTRQRSETSNFEQLLFAHANSYSFHRIFLSFSQSSQNWIRVFAQKIKKNESLKM